MSPKDQLLADVAQAIADQTISRQELESLLPPPPPNPEHSTPEQPYQQVSHPAESRAEPVQTSTPTVPEAKAKHGLSVIDILFYLAGIILFAALMTMVAQVGSDSLVTQLFISLGAGLLFWGAAFGVARQPIQNETRQGLINAMLLTGSLSVCAGGFLLTGDLTDVTGSDSSSATALAYAALLAILGVIHAFFDRLLRSPILVILGLILFVAAFPTTMVGLLGEADVPPDVWGIIAIITGLLFAYGGKIVSVSAAGREDFKNSFESVAGFIVLSSIYSLGFASDIAVFWQMLLPLTIYLAFFISIRRRSKQFLLTGSLFLVLFLITISFKYFSGFGAAFSLILSAFSILGTAFVASSINKKYLKD